jgi:hypothetical protein
VQALGEAGHIEDRGDPSVCSRHLEGDAALVRAFECLDEDAHSAGVAEVQGGQVQDDGGHGGRDGAEQLIPEPVAVGHVELPKRGHQRVLTDVRDLYVQHGHPGPS